VGTLRLVKRASCGSHVAGGDAKAGLGKTAAICRPRCGGAPLDGTGPVVLL